MNLAEKIFKIKENDTTVKTEIMAGLTTFFTMSYLFILSPKILETAGLNFETTVTVTSLIIFIGCMIMGFVANKPYAVAPFLGETAFASYTVVATLGFSIKTVFAAILISGFILLLMSLFNIRSYIVNQIPESIKIAFCSGLGLYFIFIALRSMKIIQFTKGEIPLSGGDFSDIHVMLSIFTFLLIIIFAKKNIKGGVLFAILISTLIGLIINDISLPEKFTAFPSSISSAMFQFDFKTLLNKNFIPIFFVIFLLVNIDTSGALIGLSYKTGGDKQGSMKKSMIADSLSVILSPIFGTTTSGAYLDSMTGITAGGRTGLTAVIVGILFLCGLFFTPVISIIPSYAYSPALLYVGILMTTIIAKTNFEEITEYATVIFTITAMIFSYNIGTGIILGFIIYPILKLATGQKSQTNVIVWILFLCSIIYLLIYPY